MRADTTNKLFRAATIITLALAVSACSGSGKNKNKYDDEGRERISILTSAQSLDADKAIATLPVVLPRPYKNTSWQQSGGNTEHLVQHLSIGETLNRAWRTKIGRGNQKYERLISGPVAADGRVFAVDTEGKVAAVSISTGKVLWSRLLENKEERSDVAFGGGVAYAKGKVFVTSGFGFVAALDATSGSELWRYKGAVPFRGAPTASDDKVFAITHDNQMLALNPEDGSLLWDQVGIAENAGMLGAASPAYDGTTMIAALSSGELIALRGANGRILWQDALSSSQRLTPLATLADIDGNPVIDSGKVIAASHSGRMVAIDMRSGERSWEADVASVTTPWVAGNFVFITTVDGQIACLAIGDGRVRWVTQLQRFKKPEKRKGLIKWNGPVLAGDRLIVTSTHGYILSLSPYTGEVLSGIELPSGASTPPIVVDETLVVLTDGGELVAYK
ncbi:outer membrane protein assembly factor BamB family protein [Kordiimonas pumila]|uniref:PQQ-binding-like beta-propeller repeat protein n=1 Tax=Kordiimonas pumila TaxID=2161677 RepID=A0ABV7D2F5_9PROT|nr:PQQ-binding-like beta-propeller repeat protein [Kordiimonas pumila]